MFPRVAVAVVLVVVGACTTADTTSDGNELETVGDGAAAPVVYPSQPPERAWPTDEWSVGELPVGIDRAALDAAVDAGFGDPAEPSSVRAVLAVHAGAIVYERYHPLNPPDALFPSFGMAKAVTSTLVGIAVTDGLLDPAEPTGLIEWAEDERSAITLEHLLRMTSGLEWDEGFGPEGDVARMVESTSAGRYAMEKSLVAAPGETFNYSSGSSAIITHLLSRALGGPLPLQNFMVERLLEPLQFSRSNVLGDGEGVFFGGTGFDTTARDFARIGLLHLRGGIWNGERLISESWIDALRIPTEVAPVYGGHWWLRQTPSSLIAQGLHGQYLVVAPELDLVVVVLTAPGGITGPIVNALLEQFGEIR